MHPWLLTSPPISTYGVCIVLALIAAWLWLRWRAGRAGIEASRMDLLMPLVAGTGLLGAWLFGKIADRVLGSDDHAAVLVGSLLLATAAGIVFGFASRIPLGILGDLCSAPLALGIAIGRLGCFFAGLDDYTYGTPTGLPWGVDFGDGVRRHPVQLYEALATAGMYVVLLRKIARNDRFWLANKFYLIAD